MATREKLLQRSDALHQVYNARFSGFPRATRDPELLRDLLRQAKDLVKKAESGPIAIDVRQRLRDRVALYDSELKLVREAAGNPEAARAAGLGMAANAVFHRYRRHYAGRARLSRDTEQLREMVEDLRGIADAMDVMLEQGAVASLERDRGVVQSQIELFEQELGEIESGRTTASPQEVISGGAEWANDLFAVYARQFAGLPRLSRRPRLIERMLVSLRRARDWMATVAQDAEVQELATRNVEVCTQRLTQWETELEQIRASREQTDVYDLLEAFDAELDRLTEVYDKEFAGQARGTRDLALMCGLVDRCDEVARQVADLHRAYDLEETARLMIAARDQVVVLAREYDQIAEAKQQGEGVQ